jgi:hypothetical protein
VGLRGAPRLAERPQGEGVHLGQRPRLPARAGPDAARGHGSRRRARAGGLRPDLHAAADRRRGAARAGRTRLQRMGGRVPGRGARTSDPAGGPSFPHAGGRAAGARALRRARSPGRDRQQHRRPRPASLRRELGGLLGHGRGDRHPHPHAPRRRSAQPPDEARLVAHARGCRRRAHAARRDPRRPGLLGCAREAPEGQVRDGRGGSRMDPVRDRAARPRARQVRLEDPGLQDRHAAQRDLRTTGVRHLRGRGPGRRAHPAHRSRQRDVGLGLSARRQHVAALAQGPGRVAARPARPRGPAPSTAPRSWAR